MKWKLLAASVALAALIGMVVTLHHDHEPPPDELVIEHVMLQIVVPFATAQEHARLHGSDFTQPCKETFEKPGVSSIALNDPSTSKALLFCTGTLVFR